MSQSVLKVGDKVKLSFAHIEERMLKLDIYEVAERLTRRGVVVSVVDDFYNHTKCHRVYVKWDDIKWVMGYNSNELTIVFSSPLTIEDVL